MRIAIVAPEFLPTWGGVGIYTANLVKELIKYDVELHVITPKRGDSYDADAVKAHFDDNIHLHNIGHARDTFFYNLSFQLQLFTALKSLHKKYHFDLIHSMNVVHMPDVYARMRSWDVPFITTVHTTIDSQFDYPFTLREFLRYNTSVELLSKALYPYIKFMQNRYVASSDRLICVSNYVAGDMPKEKTHIIHNGIDTKTFKPGKATLFEDIKKPKILFCGRLLYMKGIPLLIEAARQLQDKAHFVFAGQDPTKWKGMLPSATFLGHVPHTKIPEVYRSADIFVLPSFSESFPLTLLEAMSSGLAVVASDVGGIPEMIEHGKTGLLIPDIHAMSIRNSLQQLIDDKNMRKRLGKNARQIVVKDFSRMRMAQKTYRVYQEVLQDG